MGKRRAIELYLIRSGIDSLNDGNALDRILALLTQASAAIKATTLPTNSPPRQFEKMDHFFPTQKNETQLRFKQTGGNPGRKRKHVPLRWDTYRCVC